MNYPFYYFAILSIFANLYLRRVSAFPPKNEAGSSNGQIVNSLADQMEKVLKKREYTDIEFLVGKDGKTEFKSLPNCHGISDGIFPMPFSTNGRISDRKKGTLLMDIEKVSEFAREEVESSRYSEKVYINGLPWNIWAQIKMKNGGTDNKKWLSIYLLCDATEKDSNWRCFVHSATFRIVSQKNGTENSIGTRCDCVINQSRFFRGFGFFITFAELMDSNKSFYNKAEDKLALAIDVTVKDDKKEKCISDPDKSNGTLSMEIEKVSEFAREIIGSERKSETVHIKGLPWKILAEINPKNESTDKNEKWLGFYLWCDASEEENWSCKCSSTLRIVSQKRGVADFRRKLDDHVFDNKNRGWGYNFISFVELMDPSNGFYDKGEDNVKLAIDFTVKEAKMEDK